MKTNYDKDIQTIRENLGLTIEQFATALHLDKATISRYEAGTIVPSPSVLDPIYCFAYSHQLRLNQVKEILYREGKKENEVLLFHGSKRGISGDVSLAQSEQYKDFGKGFYLGETLKQATMFVASYPTSKLYYFYFINNKRLKIKTFPLSLEWVLSICYYRGYLENYKNHFSVQKVIQEVELSDIIIAPIADNQMFDIMKDFADGEITDVECIHSLAARNLGQQYVFRSEVSLSSLSLLEEAYFCSNEKEDFLKTKNIEDQNNLEKIKIIKRQYRGQGKYIDQL